MPFTNEDKHFVKILSDEKRHSCHKCSCEFLNKKCNYDGLDDLIKKTDESDSLADLVKSAYCM